MKSEQELRNPRVAIATGRYFRQGETFVNRHLRELFGGNSVVVCGRQQGENVYGKEVFCRGTSLLNPLDLMMTPFQVARNQWKYSTLRTPFGINKRRLIKFLRDHRVEAVLSEFGSQATPLWPIATELGLPMFTYFRGKDSSRYLQFPRRVEAYRRMMPHLVGIFAVSEFLLKNLEARGIIHCNSQVVPSGVDTHLFQPGEKRPQSILAVGRFVEKKAPHITLNTFLRVACDHPEARLEFIGHGPLLAKCKALAAASGVADRIVFHHQQSHDFVRQRLAETDIFIQHSVTGKDGETEGMPTAIQEAMSCGAAVLSTRHAGITEAIVEGETGLLVDEFDEDSFTIALDRLLADPQTCRGIGDAARTHAVDRFEYRKLYPVVENSIRDALGLPQKTDTDWVHRRARTETLSMELT